MKIKRLSASIYAGLTGVTLAMAMAPSVYAQETETPDAASDANVEKIAVVGARGAPRTVTSSPVPVDVFSEEDLEAVSFTDMNDVVRTLVPSYTVSREPISDGGTFIRPASLRGLPTDKTLVLVNGKRRHRAALVQTSGSGTQGPDLATIPTAAIGSVEVLRDGAAAQYGSDAIAGVMNFNLKKNAEGGSFSAEWGQYYEGDGDQVTITGNKGFSLGDDGFLSISAEYTDSEATSRGVQYCMPAFCLDLDNPVYDPDAAYNSYLTPEFFAAADEMSRETQGANVVQPWGQPNYESAKVFFNAGYAISPDMELYAFGNYSESSGDGAFNYRYPGNSVMQDVRLEDGSIYNPIEMFPGGFNPRFAGDITDYSLAGGIKGMTGDLSYDLSARYGYSDVSYSIWTTFNPSLMNESQTSFEPGDLANEETQLQADFVYDYEGYAIAFGLSYLDESYEIKEGEPTSYEAGPYSQGDPWGFCNEDGTPSDAGLDVEGLDCTIGSDDPVYTVVAVGSNGFPGYSPQFSGTYDRDSYAAYVDISGDLTDGLFGQVALRYEDYSDMGSELVYKAAAIYQLTDTVALRASYGTGFRAPTPGQQGTTNVSTSFVNSEPVAIGLFPAGSEVAQALGANTLEPETSTNITFGLTADYGDFTITADYYNIEIEDRFNSVSTLFVSTDPTAGAEYERYLALSAAGVSGAESIGGVRYFQNAFDTTTQGIDIVATYKIASEYGNTTLTASYNYNEVEFDSDPSEIFNAENTYDFLNGMPESRAILSARHNYDAWQFVARLNYYGEYSNSDLNTNTGNLAIQDFDSEMMFDIEGSYLATENMRISAGVRNLFDNYPQPDEIEATNGRVYRSDSIVDWQGGYYYVKFDFTF